MSRVDKILFPVDISEVSPKMVPWVHLLMDRFDAKVTVLFVAREFVQYSGLGVAYTYISDFEGVLMREAGLRLEEFMKEHFEGRNAEHLVAQGDPADEILKTAEEQGMDMIVIGTHGRKGLERIIFGSVAEAVVKRSPIPVLTINPYRGLMDA